MPDKFYIGQVFEGEYPSAAALFCNKSQRGENPCYIKDLGVDGGVRKFKIVPNELPTVEEKLGIEQASYSDYLSSTDWYVTRQAETGASIPPDVSVKRRAAREKISQLREKISQLREKLESQVKGDQ